MEDLRVALVQITCLLGELESNWSKHSAYIEQAAGTGARIVCFPELSLTGYPCGGASAAEFAQSLESEVVRSLLEASARSEMLVLAGLLERDGRGILHNTHLVAAPSGLLGLYRKAHVPTVESRHFAHGDDLPVFSYGGLTFGIQICYDNHFPESARTLSLRAAEVIFSPYGSPGPCTPEGMAAKRSRWLRYLPARAFDNSLFILVVNQIGAALPPSPRAHAAPVSPTPRDTHSKLTEFPGGSMALNPWGEVFAEALLAEHLLVVDLSAAVMVFRSFSTPGTLRTGSQKNRRCSNFCSSMTVEQSWQN